MFAGGGKANSVGLFSLFRKGRDLLKPLEELVVSAIEAALPVEARPILRRQIDSVTRVYRYEREVLLYPPKRLREDGSLAFPNRTLEVKLARIIVADPSGKKSFHADAGLVEGRLFDINFSRLPKDIPNTASLRVKNVKILVDPMTPAETVMPTFGPTMPVSKLKGWLADWRFKSLITDLSAPRDPKERKTHLDRIEARLPADYIEMMSVCNGFVVKECVILALEEVYEICVGPVNSWMLAATPEGALVVNSGTTTGELFFADHGGGAPIAYGTSFQGAFERLIGE